MKFTFVLRQDLYFAVLLDVPFHHPRYRLSFHQLAWDVDWYFTSSYMAAVDEPRLTMFFQFISLMAYGPVAIILIVEVLALRFEKKWLMWILLAFAIMSCAFVVGVVSNFFLSR